jgi:hypothetical protein
MTSTRCGCEPRVVSERARDWPPSPPRPLRLVRRSAAEPAPTPSARPALPAMLHGERAAFEHRLSRSVADRCSSFRAAALAAPLALLARPAFEFPHCAGKRVRRVVEPCAERDRRTRWLASLSLRIGRASASDSEM